MVVVVPAGSTWWERRDKTGGLDWSDTVSPSLSLSLSLTRPEEIDQIGRLCLRHLLA